MTRQGTRRKERMVDVAAQVSYVKVHVELSEPDTAGEWCDECALPSVVRFPITGITENGVIPLGSVACCTECGRYNHCPR